jgi:hypothetical protein
LDSEGAARLASMWNLSLVFFAITLMGCHERACERAFQKLDHEYGRDRQPRESDADDALEQKADRVLLGQLAEQCVVDRWPREVIDCIEELPDSGGLFGCLELLATHRLGDAKPSPARPYRKIDLDIWEVYPRLFLRRTI